MLDFCKRTGEANYEARVPLKEGIAAILRNGPMKRILLIVLLVHLESPLETASLFSLSQKSWVYQLLERPTFSILSQA